jgi:hypothetical protein
MYFAGSLAGVCVSCCGKWEEHDKFGCDHWEENNILLKF